MTKNRITPPMLVEIEQLLNFLAESTQLPVEQFWDGFWNRSEPKAAELTISLGDVVKKSHNSQPMAKLKQLCHARGIIGKMADKNAGLTLMPIKWYDNKIMEHLNDVNTYMAIKSEPSKKILAELKWICTHFQKNSDSWYKKERDRICIPNIYIMPKLHKTPIGIRPIIPSHSWYTTRAAKYLHRKLLPLTGKFPWIVQDRLKVITELENKKFSDTKINLATIDVTALYTSIDLSQGLKLVEQILDETESYKDKKFDIRLLDGYWIVITSNIKESGINK